MEHLGPPHVSFDLARCVQVRTSWRVRNISIEVDGGRALLRGQATTMVARQLAEHTVRDYLPDLDLENTIEVDNPEVVLLGLPLN
jgi:hypothetical protein